MTRPLRRPGPSLLGGVAPGLRPLRIGAPFDLWLFDSAAPFDSQLLSWLSQDEWTRARRFRFAAHRQRHLAAHAVLRGLLAERTGIRASALCIEYDREGKPRLPGSDALSFSLSYASAFCLLGVGGQGPIGVDIEQCRPIPDADDLAALYFTPEERAVLEGIRDESERSRAFLHGWTRKEACLKAIGTGLLYPPSLLQTDLRGGEVTLSTPSGALMATDSAMADGHVIAWARISTPRDTSFIGERAFLNG